MSIRNKKRLQRKRRIRAKISGTSECPRVAIFKSLNGIYVQVIDDVKGMTLVSSNTKEVNQKNTIEGAKEVGKNIAKKCLDKKIENIVFDRSGYKYHGKVRAVAEGMKESGIKI